MASSSNYPLERNANDPSSYLRLHKAVFQGDWEATKEFLKHNPEAIYADISGYSDTVLHIAALTRHKNFVEKLVELIPPEKLTLQDTAGRTAFYKAVISNNIEGAKAMVIKNPDLPQIRMGDGSTPILKAAAIGHIDMLRYLLTVTKDENPSPFQGHDGALLISAAITADCYDVAMHLLQDYPETTSSNQIRISALRALAELPWAFKSGSRLGFWQHCIYSRVYVEEGFTTCHPIKRLFWYVASHLVPSIKQVYNEKLKHNQSKELAKYICDKLEHTGNHSTLNSLPMLQAARNGIVELIDIFINCYPQSMWVYRYGAYGGESLLHVAVVYRQENVFNYIKGICNGACKDALASDGETVSSNILLLAATLAPSHKLNEVTGAALQMQRELQWYKEVEGIVLPKLRQARNEHDVTPRALFTKEHETLVQKGEEWMKGMASSCMVVSTLITTVVFSAAFTVPGGNISDTGTPIFLKTKPFIIFIISDSLALVSSTTSILIFFAILTSRFAEDDFLVSLPRKMIIGLTLLFFSMLAMMIAFAATFFILLRHQWQWVSILTSVLVGLPVTLFAKLQFPLLLEIVQSTYGSKFFHHVTK